MAHPTTNVTFARIQDAKERLSGHLLRTPLHAATHLSQALGANILFKLENLQRSGSFRERGFLYRLLAAPADALKRGVITAPNANGALAIARHSTRLRLRATAVLPMTTAATKVEAIRHWGTEVILRGRSPKQSETFARQLASKRGSLFVHPADDADVAAGYGTLGIEILEQLGEQRPDMIFCPVTSGALICSVATAVKRLSPTTKMIGVEPESASPVYDFFKGRHRINRNNLEHPTLRNEFSRIALSAIARKLIPNVVDDLLKVSDEYMNFAILYLLEYVKTVCEVEASTAVAALLEKKPKLHGKTVVVIISSGNLDLNLLTRIVDRGLMKSGRLSRLNILISDEPGELERLAHLVATERANILQVNHDRIFSRTPLGSARCHLTVETRGERHVSQLLATLEKHGYSFTVSQ